MKIKVCGLKKPENIEAVTVLQPDYLGFICYAASPRFIAGLDAAELGNIPSSIIKTGVFVNVSAENVTELIKKYNFEAVQLHGHESAEFCGLFKNKVKVIKAFGMDEHFDFVVLEQYADQVDYFLFDTKTQQHGGSGKTFNWDILSAYKLNVPFFLSGGLSLNNLDEVKQINHPQFYGVDLNSRFELAPGLKDMVKLKQAFALLKQTKEHEIRG